MITLKEALDKHDDTLSDLSLIQQSLNCLSTALLESQSMQDEDVGCLLRLIANYAEIVYERGVH